MIELLVFETDPERVKSLSDVGFSSFIVDLEVMGKDLRQLGYNTEINLNAPDDILNLANLGVPRIWTRVNRFGEHTKGEIALALSHGSSCIILPMVRTVEEVDLTLRYVGGRAEVCVMIETPEGVEIASRIEHTSVASAYFGLNDYSISTGNRNIFGAVADGTVAEVRAKLKSKRFGFAGLTHPDAGSPIPSIDILRELERVQCSFTFMRRSFRRDLAYYDAKTIFDRVRTEWLIAQSRSANERAQHQSDLKNRIESVRNSLI